MAAEQLVTEVLDALTTLPSFDYASYQNGIKSILGVDSNNWNIPCSAQVYGEDPDGSKAIVQRFKVLTIALGVSRNPEYSFSSQVVTNGFQDKVTDTSSALVVPVYRKYLEDHLESNNVAYTINDLAQNAPFCTAFVEKVLDPSFINDSLIARFYGQASYTEAIAYLYERLRPTLSAQDKSNTLKQPVNGMLMPLKSIAQSSLPQIPTFLNTVQANRELQLKGLTASFLTTALPITWSNSQFLQKPRFKSLGSTWASFWVADTYTTAIVSDLINKDIKSSPAGMRGLIGETYGDKLWQWMKQQQSGGYDDVFQVTGTENYKIPSVFGCFDPDTEVATDHGLIKIDSVQPGTRLLSRAPDQFGVASTERVENLTVGQRVNNMVFVTLLYGFNKEKPFASAGHIFQTATGSKAIDPSLASLENDDVRPGQLQVGDVLLRLRSDRTGYEHVKIQSIESKPARCKTIHGIHFAKGCKGNTYHANGYLVRENYPELTMDSLSHRYHSMTLAQQKTFVKNVSEMPESFRTVLGPVIYDSIKLKFSKLASKQVSPSTKASWLKQLEHEKRKHVGITSISGQFTLISHQILNDSKTGINTNSTRYVSTLQDLHDGKKLPRLTLHNGHVAVNDQLADHVSTSHLSVQWSRKLPNEKDLYEHGVLRTIYHGFAASGYTAIGPAKVQKLEQLSSVRPVAAVSDANIYDVQYSGTKFTKVADALNAQSTDKDNWTKFWRVSIGVAFDGNGGASVKVTFPDLDAYYLAYDPTNAPTAPLYQIQPISIETATETITITVQTISGMGDLMFLPLLDAWNTLKVSGGPVTAGPGFETVVITLNLMTNAVHGYYTELLSGDTGGPIHALVTSQPSAVSAARKTIDQHVTKLKQNRTSSPNTTLSSLHKPALPATQILATKFFESDNLSLADLQIIVAPGDSQLNSLSQTYLQNASTYWRAPAEVDTFGNEQAAIKSALPTSGSLTDNLGGTERTWLGQYNKAMLMQALQRDSKYTGRFSDVQATKLDYYFQGGQKGCLSVDPEFNKISSICAAESFLAQTTALNAYIEDTQDWALKFFNYETTDTQLNNQAFGMLLSPGASLTNRYAMILNALGQGGQDYDVKLWNLVRDKVTVSVSNGKITSDEAPAFLQEFMAQIITQIQSGTSSALFDQLKIDLQSIYDTYGTQVGKEIAERTFTASFELGQCFLELMVDLKDVIMVKNKAAFSDFMSKWEQKINTKFPNAAPGLIKGLRAATSIIGLGMDAFGLYMSIKWFMGWKDLSDADRASAVIGFIQTVVMTGRDLGALIQIMRGKDPSSFDYRLNCIKWNNEVGASDVGGRNVANVSPDADETSPLLQRESIEAVQNPEGESMSEKLAQTAKSDSLAEDATNTFSLTETITSVIAIAANIASAVCMGFQIKADFDENQPPGIKAMDILSEVTTCLQVVSGIVEVGAMVLGVESMAIPVVGFVIAFVGIVLMFCEMFVHRDPPEDPVNKYLDNNLDAFFTPLPLRPALTLTYSVTSQVKLSSESSLVVTISNPTNTALLFQSISVTVPAGDQDTQLFLAPSGTNNNTTPPTSPTTNIVTYGLSQQSAFKVTGSPVPNVTDSTLVARITPADSTVQGVVFPAGGLTLTITGVVNAKAGKVQVRIQESAVNRPNSDTIPNRDYYTYYYVQKQ